MVTFIELYYLALGLWEWDILLGDLRLAKLCANSKQNYCSSRLFSRSQGNSAPLTGTGPLLPVMERIAVVISAAMTFE